MIQHPEKTWRKLLAYRQEHPLGYRMMAYVLVCSLVFVVLSTSIQAAIEYRREMRVIEQRIELIRNVYLASLAKSIWDVDREQLRLQMRGILDFPDISSLTLEDADTGERLLLSAGEGSAARTAEHRFALRHETPLGLRNLGQLVVHTDLGAVYARLGWSALTLFLGQALTIFLMVLVVMLIFQRWSNRSTTCAWGSIRTSSAVSAPTSNCCSVANSCGAWSTSARAACARPRRWQRPPARPVRSSSPGSATRSAPR